MRRTLLLAMALFSLRCADVAIDCEGADCEDTSTSTSSSSSKKKADTTDESTDENTDESTSSSSEETSDGCTQDSECASTELCVQMEDGKPGFCAYKCKGATDSKCQYDCLGDDEQGYACLQGCASDGDCDDGGSCFTGGQSQGVCIPGGSSTSSSTEPTGSETDTDSDATSLDECSETKPCPQGEQCVDDPNLGHRTCIPGGSTNDKPADPGPANPGIF